MLGAATTAASGTNGRPRGSTRTGTAQRRSRSPPPRRTRPRRATARLTSTVNLARRARTDHFHAAHVRPEDVGDADGAIRLAVGLDESGPPPRRGQGRTVQGVDHRGALGAPVADVGPPGRVVATPADARHFEPHVRTGGVDLEVERAPGGVAQV